MTTQATGSAGLTSASRRAAGGKALAAGDRLGPYELVAILGAGGMGEVWRARDTRLDRIVALKALSHHLAGDEGMRQRFEREARLISNLSHPNICALYDVGSGDGVEYLVMEYLEGETLADRLARGPVPPPQLYAWAIQIADALDRAHGDGVVHRDLKPGNVMVARNGGLKLLDFGLATLVAPPRRLVESGSQVPTRAGPADPVLTGAGTVLGTMPYMAPEQLEGEMVDARSDLFAFGAILFEMATGTRAFSGSSSASLIAAIFTHHPPPVSLLQPLAPPALDALVAGCLEKNRERRWQSARDLVRQLEWIAAGEEPTRPTLPRRRSRRPFPRAVAAALVGGLALGAGAALVAVRHAERPLAAQAPLRFAITPPDDETLGFFVIPSLALSPDGEALVFASHRDGRKRLLLRRLDRLDPEPLSGTDGGDAPFFAPDGRRLGFVAGGKLRTLDLENGSGAILADVSESRGGAWAHDDTLYFVPSSASGIMRVAAGGGMPEPLTTPDAARGENSHRWPALLPGDRALLLTVRTDRLESFDDARIDVLDLDSGLRHTLVEGGTFGRFVAPDSLLFARGGSVYRQTLDLERLETRGTPTRLLSDVAYNPTSGGAVLAVGGGALAYTPGRDQPTRFPLVWAANDGSVREVAVLERRLAGGSVSPDGTLLAARAPAANDDLWLVDLARASLTRLTFEGGDERDPVWSPDGARVAFASSRDGNLDLWVVAADASAPPQQLLAAAADQVPECWTADGGLIFSEEFGEGGSDLWLLQPDGRRDPVLRTPFDERAARLSPDGRWLAYVSNETGRDEVYVQSYPALGAKLQVSVGGGDRPIWSPRGDALTVRGGGARLRVPLAGDAVLRPGAPRRLRDSAELEIYGAARDGSAELVLLDGAAQRPRRDIVVVVPRSSPVPR